MTFHGSTRSARKFGIERWRKGRLDDGSVGVEGEKAGCRIRTREERS